MRAAPDHYRGHVARTYEARRAHKPPWAAEQAAVAELVRRGPVLDVPIGTGRYLDTYREKGLAVVGCDVSPDMLALARQRRPALAACLGSILELPIRTASVGTAVCTRLLNWLRPPAMRRAVAELGRVAAEWVCSIRLGVEREWGTYTHSRAGLFQACQGWLMDAERLLQPEGERGDYLMLRFRRPVWADLVRQFDGHRGEPTLWRLAAEWADRYRLPHQDYAGQPVAAEWWSGDQLDQTLRQIATIEPRVIAEYEPKLAKPGRRGDGPLSFIRFGPERLGILDGRHRADKWRGTADLYPVLVLECSRS